MPLLLDWCTFASTYWDVKENPRVLFLADFSHAAVQTRTPAGNNAEMSSPKRGWGFQAFPERSDASKYKPGNTAWRQTTENPQEERLSKRALGIHKWRTDLFRHNTYRIEKWNCQAWENIVLNNPVNNWVSDTENTLEIWCVVHWHAAWQSNVDSSRLLVWLVCPVHLQVAW